MEKLRKIDMEKREREFKEQFGGVNPIAAHILSKQLWKVKCRKCGTVFECAEGSLAYKKELCRGCRE